MIDVRLIDHLDNNSEIILEKLTGTGRQMVRDDLEAFLIKLDELDAKENE
jgi:hypothetical protein